MACHFGIAGEQHSAMGLEKVRQQGLQSLRATVERRSDSGACASKAARVERRLEASHQSRLAAQHGALRTHHRRHQEVAVVPRETRDQPGAQERRLAGAGCPKDHHETWRRRFAQPAQPVQRFDHRTVAAEKDASVLGFQRAQSAVRRAVGIVGRRPGEVLGVKAGLLQPSLEPRQAFGRKGDMRLVT